MSGKRIGIFIGLAAMATAVGLAMATAGTGQNPTTSSDGARRSTGARSALPGPGGARLSRSAVTR